MLFDRTASMTVGQVGGDGVLLENLRLTFKVAKTTKPSENTLEAKIYNLSPDTRAKLREPDTVILLHAGYVQDTGEQLLFSGDLTRVHHEEAAADAATTIECGDGHKALRDTRISESWGAGTKAADVIRQLAGSLQVGVEKIVGVEGSYPNGLSVSGLVKDAMDSVANLAGVDWSIQDGKLMALPPAEALDGQAVLLRPDTGLLGSPEVVRSDADKIKPENRDRQRLKVRSLLNPRIAPGRRVQVESAEHEGLFKVETVQYIGDTHGDEWEAEAEVVEV